MITVSKIVTNGLKMEAKMYELIKRGGDIIFSIIAFVLCIPLLVCISIIIKITSKGKVLYKQERMGKNGRKFTLYKFRTMIQNADTLKMLSSLQLEEYKCNYKIENDPRITKFGNILRKRNLDELPQLYNILKGDLSFVGPRPILEDELEKYGENKSELLKIRPGLTGYWQVNREKAKNYEERMQMELFYVQNYNIKLDLQILLKTIKYI